MSSPVSIVIPTWNGRHLLERFLPSVMAAAHWHIDRTSAPVEIVLVDDGGTDGTSEWLATISRSSADAIRIRVVRNGENLGFGAAANRGVLEAAFPLVWLLNNDVEVSREGVSRLAAAFAAADATLFAVHSRMVDLASGQTVGTGKMGGFARGFLRVHRSYITTPGSAGPFWSMFATGGSAMFRRDLFLQLGGFDSIFAPFYLEDVELSYRAWKRGWTVRYEPRSVVRHQFSSTIGPLAGGRVERISQRNRLLFHWIHLHDSGLLRAHALWVAILVVAAPWTLKWGFLQGFAEAVGKIKDVRARRARERASAVRSDREILRIFEELDASGAIRSYGDRRELKPEDLSANFTQDVDLTVR